MEKNDANHRMQCTTNEKDTCFLSHLGLRSNPIEPRVDPRGGLSSGPHTALSGRFQSDILTVIYSFQKIRLEIFSIFGLISILKTRRT
jgi:hypothetical protein